MKGRHYVYALASDDGMTKIGCSSNVEYRTSALSKQVKQALSVMCTFGFSNRREAFRLERHLHRVFGSRLIQGRDWFKGVNKSDIFDAIWEWRPPWLDDCSDGPDFTVVVNELLDTGIKHAKIAAECGCTESYIRYLGNSDTKIKVGYDIGHRLLSLSKRNRHKNGP